MKLRAFFVVLVFALSSSLTAAEGMRLTFDISGLMLTRAAGTEYPLLSLASHAGQGDILTTDGVALNGWKPGINLKLGLAWGRLGVEVRGFTLGKWSNSAIYAPSVGALLAVETDPITDYYLDGAGSTITADNESALKGIEANLTYGLSPAIRLYGGVRYLLLDETFGLLGEWTSGDETDTWNTTNRILGAQIGVHADILPPSDAAAGGFILQGHGAVLLSINFAHVDFAVVDWDNTSEMDGSRFSPGVDAGLQFGYRFGGSFELYAGYNLLWLNSVARATDQVRGTNSYNGPAESTLVFGSLLVHGAKVGLAVHF
jgi:hypothetical protein